MLRAPKGAAVRAQACWILGNAFRRRGLGCSKSCQVAALWPVQESAVRGPFLFPTVAGFGEGAFIGLKCRPRGTAANVERLSCTAVG